ncbi:uncharacterized protein LODBEIA_P42310 [Lodderomyces beijingensis]|uniref:Formate/nitrite transporter n=1 Tax=Lodderomyces beijingensis TaxID=1775926 RepID=A0ABP0ZUM7_9ASCO
MDDHSYLTTYEAALAVVATAMKKSRLRLEVLIINSCIGGMLFSAGGMLHIVIQGQSPQVYNSNPGMLHMLNGLFYPIGLFYVVIMGVDLFNSNILFFSCALCRRAVLVVDLLTSWFISYWFNLVGNIFIGYVIFHYSNETAPGTSIDVVRAAREIVMQKAAFSFTQTLLKAIAGNFFVCMAIYLQMMVKPLHVKFFMMMLPVFTFVSLGFTHAVADMTVLIIGKIEGAPVPMKLLVWKTFLPAALGNIIGGSFFGIVICWYLHIYVVEMDRNRLDFPEYEFRDEQPEQNQDSRVIRQKKPQFDQDVVEQHGTGYPLDDDKKLGDNTPDSEWSFDKHAAPVPIFSDGNYELEKSRTRDTTRSATSSRSARSPKGVFPVYGMGMPDAKERTIAGDVNGEKQGQERGERVSIADDGEEEPQIEATSIRNQLRRFMSSRSSVGRRHPDDLESTVSQTNGTSPPLSKPAVAFTR